jgi:uncharacterized protein YecA (UPF0149 family)
MGVIAESIVAYAQPLLDGTDGSAADMQKAMTLAHVCWNLALLPEEDRDAHIAEMRPSIPMDDDEFEDFRRSVILPMILRHHEMFPHMPRLDSMRHPRIPPSPQAQPALTVRADKYPGTARNAACPCHSGKKYKRCCGR